MILGGITSLPKFPIGTRVVKSFPGYDEPFPGKVHKFSPESGYYFILYEDGDSEEMTEPELEQYIQPSDGAGTGTDLGQQEQELEEEAEEIVSQEEEEEVVVIQEEDPEPLDQQPPQEQTPPTSTTVAPAPAKPVRLTVDTATNKEDQARVDTTSVKQVSTMSTNKSPKTQASQSPHQSPQCQKQPSAQNQNVNSSNPSPKAASPVVEAQAPAAPSASTESSAVVDVVGRRVSRKTITVDGKPLVIFGSVSSYFPATKKYRVMYSDGQITDVMYQDVIANLEDEHSEANNNGSVSIVAVVSSSGQKKRKAESNLSLVDEDISEVKKRAKATASAKDISGMNSFTNGRTLTSNSAYGIVRKVLKSLIELIQDKQQRHHHLLVLNDDEVKNQAALEKFVEGGGLLAMDTLIQSWLEHSSNHNGVLLVMKVLAVLPGVNFDALKVSKMGRKLRNVQKSCRHGIGQETLIAEFAQWIVTKWRKEVEVPPSKPKTPPSLSSASPSSLSTDSTPIPKRKRDSLDARSSRSTSKEKDPAATDTHTTSLSRKRQLNGSVKKPSTSTSSQSQSNSASHLRSLMRGPAKPSDILAKRSRLGSSFARKPRRTSILIDTLTERQNRVDNESALGIGSPGGGGGDSASQAYQHPTGGGIDGKYKSGGDTVDSDDETERASLVRFVKQVYRVTYEKEKIAKGYHNEATWKKEFDDFVAQVMAQNEKMKVDVERAKDGTLFNGAKRVRMGSASSARGSGGSTPTAASGSRNMTEETLKQKTQRVVRQQKSILKRIYIPDKKQVLKVTKTEMRDKESITEMLTRCNRQLGQVQVVEQLKKLEEEQWQRLMQQQDRLRMAQEDAEGIRGPVIPLITSSAVTGGSEMEQQPEQVKLSVRSDVNDKPSDDASRSVTSPVGSCGGEEQELVAVTERVPASLNAVVESNELSPIVEISPPSNHEQENHTASASLGQPPMLSPLTSSPLVQTVGQDKHQDEEARAVDPENRLIKQPTQSPPSSSPLFQVISDELAGDVGIGNSYDVELQSDQTPQDARDMPTLSPESSIGCLPVASDEVDPEGATFVLPPVTVTTATTASSASSSSCAPPARAAVYDPFKSLLVDQENQPTASMQLQSPPGSPSQQKCCSLEKEEGELSSSEPNTPLQPL